MRKKMLVYILVVCLAAAIFSGCSQPAPASAQISAPTASMSAGPSVTPASTPSSSEQSTSVSPEAASSSPAPAPSESAAKYQVEVAYDMEAEENTQKSVDEGHSPWRLDPAYVAQVFVSLMISPEGITGDYPIPYEDFKVLESSAAESVVEVNNDKSPVSRVYLERLVRQEEGGIWTVVGYDPAS
jgi:hypothetical protein